MVFMSMNNEYDFYYFCHTLGGAGDAEGDEEDDDEVPDLVENFDEPSRGEALSESCYCDVIF